MILAFFIILFFLFLFSLALPSSFRNPTSLDPDVMPYNIDSPIDDMEYFADLDVAQEVRFQKQCFLANQLLDIIEKVKEVKSLSAAASRGSTAQVMGSSPQFYGAIHGASSAELTQRLVADPGIGPLLAIKPHILSLLMPKIKLYKVAYDSADDATSGLNGIEIPIRFEDHISEGDLPDIQGLAAITESQAGKGIGAGIKSFEWNFLGVNPAEVENNIKATLGLYFSSITEFNKVRNATVFRTDSEELGSEIINVPYRYSDLVVAEALHGHAANTAEARRLAREYNPKFFKIKVEVGWSLPRSSALALDPDYGDELEKINALLRDSTKVMFLTLIAHNISFNQDGSIELEAEYVAVIEGALSRPRETNVLAVPEPSDGRIAVLEAAVVSQRNDVRLLHDLRSQGTLCDEEQRYDLDGVGVSRYMMDEDDKRFNTEKIRLDSTIDWAEERLDTLGDEIRNLRYRDRNQAWQRIINNLNHSGNIWTAWVQPESSLGLSRRAHDADRWIEALPEDELSDRAREARGAYDDTSSDDDDYDVEAAVYRDVLSQRRHRRPTFFLQDNGGMVPSGNSGAGRRGVGPYYNRARILEGIGQVLSSYSSAMGGHDSGWTEEEMNARLQIAKNFVEWQTNQEIRPGNEGAFVPVEFVFLGDLIDAAIQPYWYKYSGGGYRRTRFGDNIDNPYGYLQSNDIRIFLGTYPYLDPRTPEDRSTIHHLPIADIPISIELFAMWFVEEIIEKNRTEMSLGEFISSIFDNLIAQSFSTECRDFGFGPDFDPLPQEHLTIVPEMYTFPRSIIDDFAGWPQPTGRNLGNQRLGPPGVTGWINLNRPDYPDDLNMQRYALQHNLNSRQYLNCVFYNAQDVETEFITSRDMGPDGNTYYEQMSQDQEQGIYHLNLGSDRGLVKSIVFNRIDQPGAREARMEMAGELGAFEQIRERYNATVTLFGNMLFYPGQHVFLNPSMVGIDSVANLESITTKLGLGGYFLVYKVQNIMEEDLYETILDCSWVHSGFITPGGGPTRRSCALENPQEPHPTKYNDVGRYIPEDELPAIPGGPGQAPGETAASYAWRRVFELIGL